MVLRIYRRSPKEGTKKCVEGLERNERKYAFYCAATTSQNGGKIWRSLHSNTLGKWRENMLCTAQQSLGRCLHVTHHGQKTLASKMSEPLHLNLFTRVCILPTTYTHAHLGKYMHNFMPSGTIQQMSDAFLLTDYTRMRCQAL